MKLKHRKLATAIAAVSSATVLSVASLAWAAPEVTLGSNAMTSTVANADSVYVRIAGPDGYFTELRGSSIARWTPDADAPDGDYRYDSYSISPSEGAEQNKGKGSSKKSGTFRIEGGLIIAPQYEQLSFKEPGNPADLFERGLASILDFLIPSVQAANLTASSISPRVEFVETNPIAGGANRNVAEVLGAESAVFPCSNLNTDILMRWKPVGNSAAGAVSICSRGTNADNSMVVDPAGDITLADSAVFIDRSDDRVGIGTTTPTRELEISSTQPAIVLRDIDSTAWTLNRTGNDTEFDITHEPALGGTVVRPFKIDTGATNNTLTLRAAGVGVGTSTPTATLHVRKKEAIIKVEDVSAFTAVRRLIELSNQGAVGFQMEDRSQAVTWDFRTSGTGNFIMNDIGDGAEVTLLRNGNMIVSGTVSEGSSRDIKTDFDVIKTTDFMDKLSKVEVLEWRYKDSGKDDRHIGPISEDFYKLFKLGPDNKHISPRDVASIALLAAKELQKKGAATSAKLEAENAALKQQLNKKTTALKAESDKLQKRLASLEKLVTNLASSGNTLGEKGSNVAIK